ncbi:MAG: hypothetical protein DRP99_04795 [Candidatus Latescibacterota bacterium]|nr:MAG: hypothetical protein DRP99_04795 [Candidatus Latescibacterota bacterium]
MLRWGIIGAGGVAKRRTMPAIVKAEGARLRAVMVRDIERAESIARTFGAEAWYDRAEGVLEDPEVDVVHVATPVYLHREFVLKAAEAGKHVLCEKPMAMNPAEAEEMVEACRRAGVVLMLAFVLRFHPGVRALREVLDELGELVLARVQLLKYTPRNQGEWRLDPRLSGGGVLMDIGSHALDLLCFLFGEVEEVWAQVGNREFSWPVEDTAQVGLKFAGGGFGEAFVSFGVPAMGRFLEVYGTKGSAFVEAESPHTQGWRITSGGKVVEVPYADLYRELVEHFSRVVEGREEPLAPGEAGWYNMKVLEAAYISAEEGKKVTLS